MTLAMFARMCEVLEYQTPTMKANTISASLSAMSDKPLAIMILSQEYPTNNIGNKRAIVWIANAMGMFEDEIEDAIHTWGDLGEAVAEIDLGNEEDSDITLRQFFRLLSLDCGSIDSTSYTLIADAMQRMSAREKKWYVRYWLQKPRNGVNNKIPLKAMALHYSKKYGEITKYKQFNEAWTICGDLEEGNEPECRLMVGNYVTPMLAKARKGKEKPNNYMMDVKYDGNRYQIHVSHGSENMVCIYNRKGKVVTRQFPDIYEIVRKFKHSVDAEKFIIDTEIYPVETDGSPAPHKLMGKRVHKLNKLEAVQECPVKLAIFDCLLWDEETLLEQPLNDRLSYVDRFPSEYRAKRFEDHTIQAAYNLAVDWGYEGIMIKDTDMAYQPGKRSKGWLKYKPPRIELDVVITSAQYGQGKRNNVFGSYGISVKNGADYHEVGKVGTGFSDSDLSWLTDELRKNVDKYEGDTYHFLPRIVLQVSSDLVTTDVDGNIGLRFPRCMRIRYDKHAAEIDTLQTVEGMM